MFPDVLKERLCFLRRHCAKFISQNLSTLFILFQGGGVFPIHVVRKH